MATLDHHTKVILAGPRLLGYFFNWALLGVLCIQTYVYHVRFYDDPLGFQCLAYSVLLFEVAQTALLTGVAFQTFVFSFDSPTALTKIFYAWFFVAVMCAVVSVTVQGFFAWRIWVLARSRVGRATAGIIELLSLVQGCAGIVLGALLQHTASTAHVTTSHAVVIAINIWVIGSAIVDVMIAVTMTILLLRLRAQTNQPRAERMINRVIRLVVETGTLTAGFAIVTLVLCLHLPGTQYYETSIYVLTKLYANTFLANLVSRAFLQSPTAHHPHLSSSSQCQDDSGLDTTSRMNPRARAPRTSVALSTYVSVLPTWSVVGEAAGLVETELRGLGSGSGSGSGSDR